MSSRGQVSLNWWGPGTVPASPAIVWCKFPEIEALGKPGPKDRPALVFKSRFADDPPGERYLVLVAYGTSVAKLGKRRHDFTIGNEMMLNLLRLPQITRFDLDRVLWLPWARPFFAPRDDDKHSTPVVSVLPVSLKEILMWTMAEREQLGLNAAYHGALAPVRLDPPASTE
ncbi:MAG: hypothetical protein ABUL73_05520 [Alphaproteobacteria bacterium]